MAEKRIRTVMATYISILRGINVSGQKLIKMDALRKAYEESGFSSVATYVQSGNIVFQSDSTNTKKLEQQVTALIKTGFGFDVPVIVLSIEKLKQLIDNNPFLKEPDKKQDYFHLTFLSEKPEKYDRSIIEVKKQEGEEIACSDEVIYLYCPNGYGKTKLTNNFLEAKLKVNATTRNWKTANELLRIGNGIR